MDDDDGDEVNNNNNNNNTGQQFIWPGLLTLIPGSVADGAAELELRQKRKDVTLCITRFAVGFCRGKEKTVKKSMIGRQEIWNGEAGQ